MRSKLGFPTRGSKSSSTYVSAQSLWLCYFRNLVLSQQGSSHSSSCISHRSFSSRSTSRLNHERRALQLWLLAGLDHQSTYLIQPLFPHRHFRARSKPVLGSHSTTAASVTSLSPDDMISRTSNGYMVTTITDQAEDGKITTTSISSKDGKAPTHLHPRWFNKTIDMEKQLRQLDASIAELDSHFIFKSLRSMLYNVNNYQYDGAWMIYQAMIRHQVTDLLRENHYGHLLNIIKYTPKATPRLLIILDHMKAAQQQGRLMVGTRHYSQVLFGMSRQGDVNEMCTLLKSLQQQSILTGDSDVKDTLRSGWYTSLAVAVKKNGNPALALQALEIIEDAMDRGVSIEKEACAVMISVLASNMNACVRFLTNMKNAGMMTTNDNKNNKKSNNDTQNPNDTIFDPTTTNEFNVHIYTSLIAGMARNGDATNARLLWNEMRKHGLRPTTATYTALTEAYGRSGNLKAAVKLLKNHTFKNNGKVNKVMATSVLTNAIRHGELDLAQSLLSTWVDKMGLEIDKMDNEFRSAVMWIKVKQDLNQARDYFDTLYSTNTDYVDAVMVNHLVKGYGDTMQKEQVMDSFGLHESLTCTDTKQLIDPHFFLVDSLFKCRDVPAALSAFVKMRHQNIPDDITFAMVIRGLVMNDENEMAWRLFQTLKSSGLEPNLHAYTSILKTCIQGSQRGARKEQQKTLEQDIPHISAEYMESSLGIASTTSAGNSMNGKNKMGPTQAYILFRKMTGFQQPNVYTYTTLIACFAKHNIRRAVDVFTYMCADGVEPVIETYVALLQGCAIFRNAPMALLIFKHMREQQHLTPDNKIWHYLLKTLVRSRVDKKEIDRLGRKVRSMNQDISI
ncbi:uncharacterized protein BX664DRAFT_321884 [Halteromyces radiatus]|uniref:uncharacterized protein n=1 Tax=Halteromyces radiatus TaxID=101107 RepID=UPI002220147B|nr:uncharacterized protein BX664DRAFT_321884 [Halteromyces radiatus]KAI8099693.1 hypothetical protein BX664DRAFT_321884 [Halteromyces radiatus]